MNSVRELSVFSTEQVRQVERPRYWREAIRLSFGNLECQTSNAPTFAGRIDAAEFRGMRMRHVVASEHRVVCSAKSAAAGFVKVLLQLRGSCHHVDRMRKTLLLHGEWMIYDTLASEEHSIENHGDVHQLVFMLPRSHMRLAAFRRLQAGAIHLTRQDPVSNLMFREIVGNTFKSGLDARAAIDSIRLVARLVPMALYDAAGQPREEREELSALASRVKQYVDTHLLDSFLTIADLAETFQCSKRALHIAFESESETLSAYIWARRLDRVRDDLTNPTLWHESITNIAFSWGFTSSAHFSRSFSSTFGQSPSSFRRGIQREASRPECGGSDVRQLHPDFRVGQAGKRLR